MPAATVGLQPRLLRAKQETTNSEQHIPTGAVAVICCVVHSKARQRLTIGEADGLDGIG